MHALHYGLLAAGLITVAILVWTVRGGRDERHDDAHDERHDDAHDERHDDAHDERVRRLRESSREGGPPSAG